jgi:hypothetical protein
VERTIIQLTDEQRTAAAELARKRGISLAALVREAVDEQIRRDRDDYDERLRRVRSLAGIGNSGLADLAERHDDYLPDAYEHPGYIGDESSNET